MSTGIYLIHNDQTLVEMTEQPYESEDLLQDLLARYPSLLAGKQINSSSPRRWLLIAREAGLADDLGGGPRWSIDHLFLDQDAIPTIVEVKRSSDTRIRREVVGQMMDYAANAVLYWPIEAVRAEFDSTCVARGALPAEVLSDFLDDEDVEAFWQRAKTNLQAGRIRLLFVADEIPRELQRIVEFLNEQMDPAEVLAVEIKQYLGGGQKSLIPRVIGQSAATQRTKESGGRPARQWDEASFSEDFVARRGDAEASVAREILTWAQRRATRIWWGQGSTYATFVPMLVHKDIKYQLFALGSDGRFEVYLQHLKAKPAFSSDESRLELLQRINASAKTAFTADMITRRPTIRMETLREPGVRAAFLAVYDWVVEKIQSS